MLRTFSILILLTLAVTAGAQPSNHWIRFDQDYYKIPVAKNGIYRLSYTALQQAGLPVSGLDPQQIQLFHRGVEQAIYVEGEDDHQLNPADFILFYGQKNDGTLDAGLYDSPEKQPHRYYNLYSDTTSYFLTIGGAAGKRMASSAKVNTGNLSPESHHLEEKLLLLTEQYNPARSIDGVIFSSAFDMNESWTSQWIRQGASRDFEIGSITDYDPAIPPEVEILVLGRNPFPHFAQIQVGPSQRLLKSLSFPPHDKVVITETIDWSDISADGKLKVRLSIPSNGYEDQVSISYVKLTFRQKWNAAGASERTFRTLPSQEGELYVQIQNPPATDRLYDISDPGNVQLIKGSVNVTLNAVIPASMAARKLFVTSAILTPAKIRKVNFRRIVPTDHNYIIVTHPRLRKPAGAYSDPVEAYASYRASDEGGAYDTLIVHTQDLYDQFNYGEASPLAIYRFVQFLSAIRPPSYLFLMGKGLQIGHKFQRLSNGHTLAYQDLVPTGGYPGSDMVYSVGINGTTYEPSIPTGRLSAMNPIQIANYLDKVREIEAQPYNQLWRKKILHLSGGVEDGETERFRNILQNFAAVAEGPYLGGQVTAIAKKSRDLEVVNIADELNAGVGLVTFFGHSSATSLDFDIGYVNEPVLGYNNKGKYPVLLMNGCQAGAFYFNESVLAENWVYTPDKGASAFIAHNSYGEDHTLEKYSANFYDVAFGDSLFFGRGLGDIQKETARRHMEQSPATIINLAQVQQMVLLGDPALRIFGVSKPDLEIKESQISVVPYNSSSVTALSDSFAIRLIVRNYGMAIGGTFRIEAERTMPDNSSVLYDSLYPIPHLSDTLLLLIRRNSTDLPGSSNFRIRIDPDDIINETDESNNEAEYTLLIPSNGTRNIYPGEFAITNERLVRLSFQSTDLFSGKRNFIVQIDTVNTFDSPFLKEAELEGEVLVSYPVELDDKDSLAYYWRTKLRDPLPDERSEWTMSSFSYVKNSREGWSQLHFSQLLSDVTIGLVKNQESRRIEFERSVTPVEVITYGASSGKTPDQVSIRIKGAEYNFYTQNTLFKCRKNTLNFVAFDKKSTSPYIGIYLKWYEMWNLPANSCGREPTVINSFTWNEVSRGGVRDVFQYVNNIAEGDSVVIFNIGNPFFELWPESAKIKLGELGISLEQVNGIMSGEPVVIFAKKGSPAGSAALYRSANTDPLTAELKVHKTVSGGFNSGTMSTSLIGPAESWHEVYAKSGEAESQDQRQFNVVGIRLNGTEEALYDDVGESQDLSAVDAVEFPYLRLQYVTTDTLLLTPVQLRKWFVFFTPVPEGILLPGEPDQQVSLQEGKKWTSSWRFVNISDRSFADSLRVNVRLFNKQRNEALTKGFKIAAPSAADTTHFTLSQETGGLAGLNDVHLFVNPRILPEIYYDNNAVQLNNHLSVTRDNTAPVLDVTFDGRHLLNGDYVSASPDIQVKMWDENEFFFKSDTLNTRIFLTYPCDSAACAAQNIWFSRPDISWSSASAQSDFHIRFKPQNLTPGNYQLRIEAADASGNPAGPYVISFVVSDEQILSILHPHPNPFQDEASFGFHLSADGPPSSVTLEVSDITGKVLFIGSYHDFHVGKNLFVWTGVDSNGNQLSSGLYPYRITIVSNGAILREQGKILIAR